MLLLSAEIKIEKERRAHPLGSLNGSLYVNHLQSPEGRQIPLLADLAEPADQKEVRLQTLILKETGSGLEG